MLKIWQNHASRLDIWIFHVSRLSAWIDYRLLSGTSWCQLYMWKTLLGHLYDIMCSFIVGFCCLVIWQFLIASRLWLISRIILRFECCWLYMSIDIAHSSWAYEYTSCGTVALIGLQISENWPRTIRATVPQLMNTPDVVVFRLHA